MHAQPILVVTGQTATGKTKLALSVAQKVSGDILSADSRQIYKYLDIISGKDVVENNFVLVTQIGNYAIGYYTVHTVRIWLYDVVDPKQYFSSYDWALCAQTVLTILRTQHKTPLIVGGSYFYIKALIDGLISTTMPNWQLRRELETVSVYELQNRLKITQPDLYTTMNRSDKYNRRRLIRKLEQTHVTNQNSGLKPLEGYNIQWVGLIHQTSEELKKAIENRVKVRMKQGATDEVALLMNMGYSSNYPGMHSIGYRQLADYSGTDTNLKQALAQWIVKELQYAKRQKTAISKDKRVRLFLPHEIHRDILVSMLE